MPTENKLVPVIFQNGINSKIDPKVLQAGLLTLENRVMNKLGRLEKRNGFTALSNLDASGNEISSGNNLAVLGDDLLLLNQDKLYSYVASKEYWQVKGNLTTATVTSTPNVRNSGSQYCPDYALLNGISCTVWGETVGVKYSVMDTTSGSFIVSNSLISATSHVPKVVAIPTGFLIFRLVGTAPFDLITDFVPISAPSTIIHNTALASAAVASTVYDVINYADFVLFAYANNSSRVTVGYVDSTGHTSPILPTSLTTTITDSPTAISLAKDEFNNSIFVAVSSASQAKMWRLESSLVDSVVNTASTVLDSVTQIKNITAIFADGIIKVFYEVGDRSTPTNQQIRFNSAAWDTATRTLTHATAATLILGAGLVTKAFTDDVMAFSTVVFPSIVQPVYFTIDETGQVVAKEAQGLGGSLTSQPTGGSTTGSLCSVSTDSQGFFNFAVQVRTKFSTTTGTGISLTYGLNTISLNIKDFSYNTDALGKSLIISGGIVSSYDGNSVTELGYNVFPDTTTLTRLSSGVLSGEYSYRVIYEWTDAKGQVHRSAPSITTSIGSGVGGDTALSSNKVQIVTPMLRITKKTGVKVVVYRALANLSDVFYRLQEAANDPTTNTVTFTDNASDASIQGNEILYTTGGILENIAPPACQIVHRHQNRMFLAGLEDPDTFWYSKEYVPGEGVSFSDGFIQQNDTRGGDITALGTLDDKLLVFKSSAVFFMAGQGPIDTGAGNDYTRPQLVQGDVGAISQDSVVITPSGVMFQSAKGIWLVDRSLTLSYLGAPADDFNNLMISSAVVIADSNQVRFTTSSGTAIVYDYYFQQWYTFTNYYANSAIIWKDTYLHLTNGGLVNQEVEGSYNDNGAKITTRIETNWLVPGGLQGFQRIKEILMLGEYNDQHTVRVSLAYDYEKVYNEIILFAADEVYNASVYGSGAYYGTLSPYGGNFPSAYQFIIRPARQKCESFKVLIEDIDNSQSGGPAFSLSAMSCWVGLKGTRDRLGSAQAGGGN